MTATRFLNGAGFTARKAKVYCGDRKQRCVWHTEPVDLSAAPGNAADDRVSSRSWLSLQWHPLEVLVKRCFSNSDSWTQEEAPIQIVEERDVGWQPRNGRAYSRVAVMHGALQGLSKQLFGLRFRGMGESRASVLVVGA